MFLCLMILLCLPLLTSSDSITGGGGAASTNEGDQWTLLKHIGVVRILGVEKTERNL